MRNYLPQLSNFTSLNKLNSFNKFLVCSLIIHTLIIFTLSIKWYTNIVQSTKAIDVTLINSHNNKKPLKSDYLAEADNQGGGNIDKKNNPSINQPADFPDDKIQELTKYQQQNIILDNIDKKIQNKTSVLTAKNKLNKNLENKKHNKINNSEINNQPIEEINFIVQTETIPIVSSLLNNIEQRAKLYAKRPKTRFLSASSQEYRDAKYLDNWRKKIELYGNKYYPEQAKSRNLSGDVIMLVGIKSNGQIAKIKIEKSSGIKILDDAAIQTVHLAAPFERFTKEMQKDTDILEIVRTWSFNDSGEVAINKS